MENNEVFTVCLHLSRYCLKLADCRLESKDFLGDDSSNTNFRNCRKYDTTEKL
jgi:hypothetical protein